MPSKRPPDQRNVPGGDELKLRETDNLQLQRQLLLANLLEETTLPMRLNILQDPTVDKVLLCKQENGQQTAVYALESGCTRNDICFTPCGIDPDTCVNGAVEVGRFWKLNEVETIEIIKPTHADVPNTNPGGHSNSKT